MSASLPARPDLEQLRRQAKELRDAANRSDPEALARMAAHSAAAPGERLTLAAAQLTIAREFGFWSWPAMKAAVDGSGIAADVVSSFLRASVESRENLAAAILGRSPLLVKENIFTAAVLGEIAVVADMLGGQPELAQNADADLGWPPLLFACYSGWPAIDPSRADGVVGVAELLLDAGASANSHNGQLPNRGYRSALHGAVQTNNAPLVKLLLARGASVEDRISLRAAAEHTDHECLKILVEAGASVRTTWALQTAAHRGDAEALRILLEAASRFDPPDRLVEIANELLAEVASRGDWPVLEALLAFGADAGGADPLHPPIREAVRSGHFETARRLAEAGAVDSVTEVDRLLGACAAGDRAQAETLIEAHPRLIDSLSEEDRASIVEYAENPGPEAVTLMLDLGFSVRTRNEMGETALHNAAFHGRSETARVLLAAGAEIDARDANFDGTPLGYATVGSGERPNEDGDWPATVWLLLEAGAADEDVWFTGDKAPSEDVVEVLQRFGVQEEGSEPASDEEPTPVVPVRPDRYAHLAARLSAAYASGDIEAFGALLHPQVKWGGGVEGCSSRADVLRWYGGFMELGLRGLVTLVEEYPAAFLVGLSVLREPEGGAAPGPAAEQFQVFKVRDGLIGEIAGNEDLDEARLEALRLPSFREI